MADNLSVSISAETTRLTAGLALARADFAAFNADLKNAAATMRTEGVGATEDMRRAFMMAAEAQAKAGSQVRFYSRELASLNAPLQQVAAGHEELRLATAGSTREFIVLAHEMIQGNFSRLPGSIMVLGERMGALHQIVAAITPAMLAGGGAALAFAGAIGAIALAAAHSEAALDAARDAFSFRNIAASDQAIGSLIAQLRQVPGVSAEAAAQIARTFAEIKGGTLDLARAMTSILPDVMKATGQDAAAAAKSLADEFKKAIEKSDNPQQAAQHFFEEYVKSLRAMADQSQPAIEEALSRAGGAGVPLAMLSDEETKRAKQNLEQIAAAIRSLQATMNAPPSMQKLDAGAAGIKSQGGGAASANQEVAYWQSALDQAERYGGDVQAVMAKLNAARAAADAAASAEQIAQAREAEDTLAANYRRLMDLLREKAQETAKDDALAKKSAEDETRGLEDNYRALMRVIDANKQKNNEIVRDAQRAAQEEQRQWQGAFQPIGRAFDEMVSGMLNGTQTIEKTLLNAFQHMAATFIEAVAKMTAQWLAFEALQSLGFAQSAGAVGNPFTGGGLGGLIGGLFGGGAAAGGVLPELAQFGTGIAAFASGAWSLPNDMYARVHQNEMIVPAGPAAQLRSMLTGGSAAGGTGGSGYGAPSFPINVTALDARSVSQLFNNTTVLRALMARIRPLLDRG